jgi:hypothetical protein
VLLCDHLLPLLAETVEFDEFKGKLDKHGVETSTHALIASILFHSFEILEEEIGLMEELGCAVILILLIRNLLVVALHLPRKLLLFCVLEQGSKGPVQNAAFVHLQTDRPNLPPFTVLLQLTVKAAHSIASEVFFEHSFLSFE